MKPFEILSYAFCVVLIIAGIACGYGLLTEDFEPVINVLKVCALLEIILLILLYLNKDK